METGRHKDWRLVGLLLVLAKISPKGSSPELTYTVPWYQDLRVGLERIRDQPSLSMDIWAHSSDLEELCDKVKAP